MQIKTQCAITSHLLECLPLKSKEITSVDEEAEKRKPMCTIGGNVFGVTTMENRIEIPEKKLKIELL